MAETPSNPLPTYADALDAARALVPHPGPTERVPLDAADGRVLREPIHADRDLPPFNRAQMDGYALRHADLAAALAAINTAAAPTVPPTADPAHATDPPAHRDEPPTAATDSPAHRDEPPTAATDSPAHRDEPPTAATDPPAHRDEPPTAATDPPAHGAEPPTAATDPPAHRDEPPTASTDRPAHAADAPTNAAHRPTAADAAGASSAGPAGPTADAPAPPSPAASPSRFAVSFPVVRTVAAGDPPGDAPPAGTCVKIATGAPLPPDLDLVIEHERTDRAHPTVTITLDRDPDTGEATVPPRWRAVHRRAADASANDTLLPAGVRLRPHHLAIAAATGAVQPLVAQRPAATILTSGDEVHPASTPTADLAPHHIRNTNAVLLARLLVACGGATPTHVHLPDDPDATRAAVAHALATADLVVTVGGVSAGERDWFPDAFAAAGVHFAVTKAAIQPGKPIRIGHAPRPTAPAPPSRARDADDPAADAAPSTRRPPTRPAAAAGGATPGHSASSSTGRGSADAPRSGAADPTDRPDPLVIALPGNPVSALACGCLFLWPLIRAWTGETSFGDPPTPWFEVELAAPVKPNPRREAFRPAVLRLDGRVEIPSWAGSGDLAHTAATDGLLALPAQTGDVPAGARRPFLPWPWRT